MKNEVNVGDLTTQQRLDLARGTEAAPVGDDRGHDTKGSRKALGAMNAKLKAKIGRLERELAAYQREQQPSAGVVMPGRAEVSVRYGYRSMGYAEGWNACLDEFARLNGKEVV